LRYLLLIVPLGLLGLAVHAAWRGWGIAPDSEIGWHGVVALLLGIGFSLALAGLLVWLMQLSRRRGLDQ
jgi:hypothetical protein